VPEGDTIHYAASRIRAVLEGRVPREITMPNVRHAGSPWPRRLHGRAVQAIDAHGKHLFLRFEGDLTLHSHLRMTGHWDVYRDGARWRRSPGRAWLVLGGEGFDVVQFDGPVLELLTESRARSDPRLAQLGPDILGDEFDGQHFLRRLRDDDPTRAIGDALLDQRTVAGIGNLWKAEACFAAAVDPWRAAGTVGDGEALALVAVARDLMAEPARSGHTSRPRAVYRRAGEPCPRCGTTIRAAGQGDDNRQTYWCPGCQR
jgi:endonuclease-8